MNERYTGVHDFIGIASSFAIGFAANGILANINDSWHPTPTLEASTSPNVVVFQATADQEIAKGIDAALKVCEVRNVRLEQRTGGKTKAAVECTPGTLMTRIAIVETSTPQGR